MSRIQGNSPSLWLISVSNHKSRNLQSNTEHVKELVLSVWVPGYKLFPAALEMQLERLGELPWESVSSTDSGFFRYRILVITGDRKVLLLSHPTYIKKNKSCIFYMLYFSINCKVNLISWLRFWCLLQRYLKLREMYFTERDNKTINFRELLLFWNGANCLPTVIVLFNSFGWIMEVKVFQEQKWIFGDGMMLGEGMTKNL